MFSANHQHYADYCYGISRHRREFLFGNIIGKHALIGILDISISTFRMLIDISIRIGTEATVFETVEALPDSH